MKLLKNPSMENIDIYDLDMRTYNGDIINFIKNSLEKEIPSVLSKKMKNIIYSIV